MGGLTLPKSNERSKTRDLSIPFWQTLDEATCRLWQGDVCNVLAHFPDKVVQCVVTSPPYWGLRDYGTGTWIGGKENCDHIAIEREHVTHSTSTLGYPSDGGTRRIKEGNNTHKRTTKQYVGQCSKCGAKRVDMQIGSEPSPDCNTHGQAQCGKCFVCAMVKVFRQVRRVLRDDGTLWLNLGDTYASGGKLDTRDDWNAHVGTDNSYARRRTQNSGTIVGASSGLPPGNLVGIPWRVALALQADGWVLRQDIIWAKPSPMPESVTNRCTKSHEYVFLLTKSNRYYCDMEAIKEGAIYTKEWLGEQYKCGDKTIHHKHVPHKVTNGGSRNRRSVWSIPSEAYGGSHYAVFPKGLIEPMVLAGSSAHGACEKCGSPWRRVTSKEQLKRKRPNDYIKRTGGEGTGNSCANTVAGTRVTTVGWEPTCKCGTTDVRPCIVLDPFVGAGTLPYVAILNGRWGWGIDLSQQYLECNAVPRLEGYFRAIQAYHLVPRPIQVKVTF